MSQYVYLDEYIHTHIYSFLLHTKPQKRIIGSHIHTCAILVFIASFPNVLSTLCNQTTHQLFFHILANVCQRYYEQRQKDNTCENISAEILIQFNFLKWSCDYPLFISQLTRYLSNCQRILFSHDRENKQASSLLCFLSGH